MNDVVGVDFAARHQLLRARSRHHATAYATFLMQRACGDFPVGSCSIQI
jgi:hypothetical protein